MKQTELKASVTLRGNNGVEFVNITITQNDIITLIKQKALENIDSSYYDEVEYKIDEVKVN
jgi:hypothetical protein